MPPPLSRQDPSRFCKSLPAGEEGSAGAEGAPFFRKISLGEGRERLSASAYWPTAEPWWWATRHSPRRRLKRLVA